LTAPVVTLEQHAMPSGDRRTLFVLYEEDTWRAR
jgi:hypothetical protein